MASEKNQLPVPRKHVQVSEEERTTQFAPNGKFAPGNKMSRGNPLNKKIQQLRASIVKALTDGDIEDIMRALIKKAKAGDVIAAREVFDRALGKAQQHIEVSTAEMVQRVDEMSEVDLIRVLQEKNTTEEGDTSVETSD